MRVQSSPRSSPSVPQLCVSVVPMTRKAPVGHSKVPIPGPSRAAMQSLPDWVDCLVVLTSSWIEATAPSPQDNTR